MTKRSKHKRRKVTTYLEDRRQLRMTQFPSDKRQTYAQNWKAYDDAQCGEQDTFLKLLSDLCRNVDQPAYDFGRPRLPLSDMVFASALKVYSTFSLRRFMSQMQKAVAEGHVDTFCSYSSVSNYMRKKELTPILYELIKLSSLPLASVETTFGVDSSGFGTSSRFARYFDFKHGKDKKYKKWVKAHICCGLKTNVITAVQLTDGDRPDHPYFQPLLEKTAQSFNLKEAVADKAYLSRTNLQFVEDLGGKPFIPFKVNSRGLAIGAPAWNRMYHYFNLHRDDFMKHYHKRSNVETAFHMIKTKFREYVRSKDETAQFNEVLLKILCHNICVVIQEIHELGIRADFSV
ncbi:transposase family protein [Candidatus Nitrososphaera evergladensis SR1]|uniref:Transposase family protein n=2 Tax=Nitrososphaera TaxID=497726 RepID=A0A075MQV3_9ARCH|nr:transposase family protein [Candidatus Nitrososphaera evergladensis SR1]AIF83212.1 transposase family protein [Candidatus Nitrososphaera evergladensis SR1]